MEARQAGGAHAASRSSLTRLHAAWLPLVVVLTLAYWWLSLQFNPATVSTWLILAVGWFWMWLWWRVHHLVPSLSIAWFAPRLVVVSLTVLCLVWSMGLPLLRDQAMVRSARPDGTFHVVLTGYPGGWEYQLGRETFAGLFLDDMGTLDFHPALTETEGVPDSFDLEWFPQSRLVALKGDGRYAAVFDYDSRGLHEHEGLRHAHDKIRKLVAEE